VTSLTTTTCGYRGTGNGERRIVRTHRLQFAPKLAPSHCALHPRPRAWPSRWKAYAGYPEDVSAERDELRELVERLPDEEVPAVLSAARRHLGDPSGRAWPPAFFGSGRVGRTDVAERAEELLEEGFGQPA
jgi:hypothetical protein